MLKSFFFCGFILLTISVISLQTNAQMLIDRVSVNQTQIAFSSAGKIWVVDRNGGTARRLTTTPNEEMHPIFSPDGKQIASACILSRVSIMPYN
jgi:tricorn protease